MFGLIENVFAFLRGMVEEYMSDFNIENSQSLMDELFGEEN